MDGLIKLKNSINSIISLSDDEYCEISDLIQYSSLDKGEYVLMEGKVCDFISFVTEGILIYYVLLENGDEYTVDFAFEGDWVTNNLSRINQSASLLNIKVVQKAELLSINNNQLTDLCRRNSKIESLVRIIVEQSYLKIVQQNIDLRILTAKERYEKLFQQHPDIFNRIHLYHIANYLGIAPKSLSRIRKDSIVR